MTVPLAVILGAAVVLASAAAVLLTWRRLRDLSPVRRALLAALRGLSIICLLAMLANPISRRLMATEAPPRVVVLADRSASMSLEDAPEGVSRFAWMAAQLQPEGPVGKVLSAAGARCYVFADEVREARLPLAGSPDGPATDLAAALRAAVRSSALGPPDAIVAITDGAANRGPDREATAAWLSRMRVPVYCVGVGGTQGPADVWLARVDAPRVVRAGTTGTVTVGIASRGLAGKAVRVTLTGDGLPSQDRQVSLDRTKRQRLEFALRPTRPGVHRCRVAIGAVPGEWTGANNARTFYVRVVPGETKLLVLGGKPDAEFKFLVRALEGLTDIRATCLVRKGGEGFAEIGSAARGRRPPSARALDAYDAVMLQDVPAAALGGSELADLVRFVGERGGGLGMLGGSETFGSGGYAPTVLAPVLGIRLEGDPAYSTVPVKAAKGAGDLPPVADIERHEDFPGWPSMPLLGGLNPVAGVRPGASVPLRSEGGEPLLVVQRYGRGRSLSLLTGGTHRWVLSRDATEASRRGHGAFWRVVAAWLTTPPNRAPVALETDRDVYEVGETARVVVQVTDVGFQPVSAARVVVTSAGAPGQVVLAETAGSPGRYEGGLPLTASGPLRLTATAAPRGAQVGSDSREIAVEPSRLELADPAQDVAFLRALVEASGGAYLAAEEVSRLPELLKLAPHRREVSVQVAWARSAWALALLMALLGGDWLLRRWWGVG